MRCSPDSPGQLALEERAKEEFLLSKEGPRGWWMRGIWVAPEGLNFFPSTIFTCVLLSQISLLLLWVTVKFGFAPFCFDQYATACEQGQSAETCYASWNILREKLQERVIVYQEVWEKIEEHHDCLFLVVIFAICPVMTVCLFLQNLQHTLRLPYSLFLQIMF